MVKERTRMGWREIFMNKICKHICPECNKEIEYGGVSMKGTIFEIYNCDICSAIFLCRNMNEKFNMNCEMHNITDEKLKRIDEQRKCDRIDE